MAITLGPITFDPDFTSVREKLEEVGGKDARVVMVSGLITNESTADEIQAALDAILDAASEEDYSAELSVRPGRRMLVRRASFTRDVNAEKLTGAFTLNLEARDPFEESVAETSLNWNVTMSGQTLNAQSAGTAGALPVLTLVASGNVIDPAVGDGERTIMYHGTVQDGESLVMDARARTVTLEGADVTPYTSGLFPQIAPEGTTLTYADDAASSHTTAITVAFHDRWH